MAEILPLATQQQILDQVQAQRDARTAAFRAQQNQGQRVESEFGAALQADADFEQAEIDENAARLDFIERAREERLQADLAQLSLVEPGVEPGPGLSQAGLPRGSLVDIFA